MATANELLLDAAINHHVDLTRYSNTVVQDFMRLLNQTDSDLMRALADALDRLGPDGYSVRRLDSLLASVRALNAEAYRAADAGLSRELRDLTSYEAGYQTSLFKSVLPEPVIASLQTIDAAQVYAAAVAEPFQGRLMSEWADSLEVGRAQRISDIVRQGFVANKSISDIVSELRGTRAAGYEDGALQTDRRNAEAVVRTSVGHFAAVARDAVMTDNADIVKTVRWVSTLDNRTTIMCIVRDGLEYTNDEAHDPVGGHDVPWGAGPGQLHWNCRSTSVPVLKSWSELTGENISEFTPTDRASMNGAVPAATTYQEWLTTQPDARQDAILGATRGALFRRGGLGLDRFVNDKGMALTLDQMRARDATAFARAGV